jgi:hypothetical protein
MMRHDVLHDAQEHGNKRWTKLVDSLRERDRCAS